MDIGAREAKRLEWLERIERQARSGLTGAKFCEQESIGPASFYQWKRKLARDTPDARDLRSEFGNGRPWLRSQAAATGSKLASDSAGTDSEFDQWSCDRGTAMLSVPSSIRIFVATTPTDMRKQFDGLQGVVTNMLQVTRFDSF